MRANNTFTSAAVVTAVSALLAASSPAVATPDMQQEPDFTDEQFISGLVFGEGPVAERIGVEAESPNLTSDQQETVDQQQNAVTAKILENPETPDALDDITSGDPREVDTGSKKLVTVTEKAVAAESEKAGLDSDVQPACGFIAVCGAVSVAAVVAGAAVAVVVERYLGTTHKVEFDTYDDSELAHDEYVAAVTEGLAGTRD